MAHEGIISTTYCGPRDDLSGKAALVRNSDTGRDDLVLAQFNDLKTGLGNGWHEFRRADFLKWSPRV